MGAFSSRHRQQHRVGQSATNGLVAPIQHAQIGGMPRVESGLEGVDVTSVGVAVRHDKLFKRRPQSLRDGLCLVSFIDNDTPCPQDGIHNVGGEGDS